MRKVIVFPLICVILLAGSATAIAGPAGGDQDALRNLLQEIDSSVIALRMGDTRGAEASLWRAFSMYRDNLKKANENKFDDELRRLDNYIENNLFQQPLTEGNIFTLRGKILDLADKLDIRLSFGYEHAMFSILGIAVILSLLITLITKRVVDWPKVKQIKKEVDDWRKQLLEAQRKKDMKRLYKLQQDQKRIMGLQGQMMMASFKPAIFYIVPYMLLWIWLSGFYRGWVVAWLPFSLPLPIYGTMVSCGFLSWFLLSYFGFSSIWRRLLIGD